AGEVGLERQSRDDPLVLQPRAQTVPVAEQVIDGQNNEVGSEGAFVDRDQGEGGRGLGLRSGRRRRGGWGRGRGRGGGLRRGGARGGAPAGGPPGAGPGGGAVGPGGCRESRSVPAGARRRGLTNSTSSGCCTEDASVPAGARPPSWARPGEGTAPRRARKANRQANTLPGDHMRSPSVFRSSETRNQLPSRPHP